MNLTKSEKIRLGTFVATGAVMFFGGALTLAGLKVWEQRDVYTVYFKESVAGLENSSQVRYQGLRVGRVEAMRVAPKDPGAIEVTLSLETGTVLYEGTTAVLDMSGITGLKTINLTAGDHKKAKIKPGAELPAGESFVDRMTGKAESIGIKLEMVSNQLIKWTRAENRERIERLIDSSNKLLEDVDVLVVEARPPLVSTLTNVSEASKAMKGTAIATTKTLDSVREELRLSLTTARTTMAEVRRILKAVDEKSVGNTVRSAESAMTSLDARLSDVQLGKTVKELHDAMVQLTSLLEETDLAVRASREDFVLSLKHVRQATEDLREFSRIIAQDPSVLIRGTEVE